MTATLAHQPFAALPIRSSEAFAKFAEQGIPTSRNEEWRFTPVRHLGTTEYRVPGVSPRVTEADIAPFLLADGLRVVVIDGRVDLSLSRLSRDSQLRVSALAGDPSCSVTCAGDSATADATPFAALNTAAWTDGAAIHIDTNATLDQPIEVLHVATDAAAGAAIMPRTVIYAASTTQATVIESFVSLTTAEYFTNAVCEVVMDNGARLEHVRLQRESAAATHIGLTTVHQAGDSHYRSFALALGGKLSRHDLHARHDGEEVETLLYGLYLGRGEQLHDSHTAIFHDQPNCRSWEVYKGVLAEHSRGVFNGKVIVQPVAQKTDAKQTNRNLLLSDDARVHTKPQLEIFADDVRCTHGATVGKLNEQQRFYLRTRGIAGREAEVMLITAFVAEVVEEIANAPVRATVEALVHAEMDALIG